MHAPTTITEVESLPPRQFDDWLPADLLAFSGRGAVSLGIKLGSCSAISHVGAVAWTPRWQLETLVAAGALHMPAARLATWPDRFLLYESTTLNAVPCAICGRLVSGVQAGPPAARVAAYEGRVWRYRLTPHWRRDFSPERSTRLSGHLLARIGQQYDAGGALLSGTRWIKHCWPWGAADRSTLFCSEYLAAVLQHVGLFPLTNASKFTPGGLIRQLVASEIYLPAQLLKG